MNESELNTKSLLLSDFTAPSLALSLRAGVSESAVWHIKGQFCHF